MTSYAVIAWDASFRESFHTIDSFCAQIRQLRGGEFIWVEQYQSLPTPCRDKLDAYDEGRALLLGDSRDSLWHLGRMMNAAVASTTAEVLVMIDGDILADDGFLAGALEMQAQFPDRALYVRRWDEPAPDHSDTTLSLERLRSTCRPAANMNYAPCLIISRGLLDVVGGWTEHEVFAGPGAVAAELAARITNAGIPHWWPPQLRVFHPWHTMTGSSKKNPLVQFQHAVIREERKEVLSRVSPALIDQWVSAACARDAQTQQPKRRRTGLRRFLPWAPAFTGRMRRFIDSV